MSGLDWNAIGTVAEMLGVADVETFIAQLALIRDQQNENSNA